MASCAVPATSQTILRTSLSGISGEIAIFTDAWGIPHVQAGSESDVFFANGYIHAQDRLWQMDAARRRALGRFAQWAGQPALNADVLMRRLGVERVSRADYAALSEETRQMCERYAQGVNTFVAQGALPLEYRLLGEVPEPWEGWHCVAVMRQRGLLMGSLWFKLWRAAAYGLVGAQHLPLLRYDDGGVERFVVPQDRLDRRWAMSLETLAPAMEGLAALFAADVTGGGSNNWAVDGRHTASGYPILAGDPHRVYEIPGMYCQIHLACDSFDALGLSVPGVPGLPHFGHNAQVAWGVTHAFADIHDLYIEDFSGQPPGCCRTESGPQAARHRQERIHVRGGEAVDIDVWETRHGPLILGGPAAGCGIALKSMQLQAGDRSLDCLLPMLRASSVTAFYDAMEPWGVIDHNLVAADRSNKIGVLVRARVPVRDRINGWLPVPGWTKEYAWRGIIPFARMPREECPPSGVVVTANNRTVPDDWPDYLCTDCHPATRAKRIRELLRAGGAFTPDAMQAILSDTCSAPAREIVQRLLQVQQVQVQDEASRALIAVLQAWDGDMRADWVAPAVYTAIRQEMTRILAQRSGLDGVAGTPIASIPPGISPLAHLWWTLPDLLRRDDVSLLKGLDWDAVMRQALATVAARKPSQSWGQVHAPDFSHPLAAVLPQHAARLAPDSAPVGGDGDCVLATGALPHTGLQATYGPVAKYIWDLADWDRSRWVVFHGASGDPDSPHYRDQNAIWARGELVPALYSFERVRCRAVRVLYLTPPGVHT